MSRKDNPHFISLFFILFLGLSFFYGVFFVLFNGIFAFLPSLSAYLIDTNNPALAYNILRSTRGSGDLDVLMKHEIPGREAERYELVGDVLVARSGSLELIRSAYLTSITYAPSPRVEEKLRLLDRVSSSGSSSSGSTTRETATGSSSLTGSTGEIQAAKERREDSENNRDLYLEKSYEKYMIEDTRAFLDLGIERKDW